MRPVRKRLVSLVSGCDLLSGSIVSVAEWLHGGGVVEPVDV
jgi:hypothetical protein